MDKKEEKTIYNLNLHETLFVAEKLPLLPGQTIQGEKFYEVTRVPGGWIYAMDFPGVRQTSCVFVPWVDAQKPNFINKNIKVTGIK